MNSINRQHTEPLHFPRTRRRHAQAVLTSLPAGKMVPLAVTPLLREDAMSGSYNISVEMLETREILMNPVSLRITAYVVPLLAFERFEGSRDQFDRSYMGEPQVEGGDVVPFIETHAMGAHGSNAVYKALGLHGQAADQVNTAYLEAYNLIWNFRARNRSPNLAERTRLDATLAPAFWLHSRFQHVVPDFDQAVIDGEVALTVVEARMPISGLGVSSGVFDSVDQPVRDSSGADVVFPHSRSIVGTTGDNNLRVRGTAASGGYPDVFAELQANGIAVSLANLEVAKKTQAFAKMRERYQGHDEEWIIDMLMDGLVIPDQYLKQPILLADQTVRFGQVKRYATDAGNQTESAVSGGAAASLRLRVPRLNTGGVVMILAECLPEQLFERQADPFFFSANVDSWPEALRDTLDPEKVDVVKNREIDVSHATPASTFGYAPMNWKWTSWGPRVGGKFYRPTANTVEDEERQRLWAVETVNPTLAADFYIVSGMHTKPFLDAEAEPFEATLVGDAVLEGNTQFGGVLVESDDNYDAVMDKVPDERIEK
jgi:hypothetical protein